MYLGLPPMIRLYLMIKYITFTFMTNLILIHSTVAYISWVALYTKLVLNTKYQKHHYKNNNII